MKKIIYITLLLLLTVVGSCADIEKQQERNIASKNCSSIQRNLNIKSQKYFQQNIQHNDSLAYKIILFINKKLYIFLFIIFVIFFIMYIRQKTLKNRLEKLNRTLEERIKEEVEKSRIQDQKFFQQSRLAQMGEMISMIAHQWRQPLAAISATTSNLKFKIMLGEIDPKFFEQEIDLIDQYSQHLSKTIDDFRGFFKKNKNKEVVTLEDMIKDTLTIVDKALKNKNIDLLIEYNCHKQFKVFHNEIIQVILNLIKNAEDALLENSIENPKIIIKTDCNDDVGTITIQDNAGGVPQEIMDKIFDPYFSTKLEKDGTGLGLYMSKTIVEQHCNGKIYVANSEDGAIFTIELNVYKNDKEQEGMVEKNERVD